MIMYFQQRFESEAKSCFKLGQKMAQQLIDYPKSYTLQSRPIDGSSDQIIANVVNYC